MTPLSASVDLECQLWRQGFERVAGVDEAGRGALAGPLVAAAVILRPNAVPDGLRDSKQLTQACRERLFDGLVGSVRSYHIVVIENTRIDALGIHHANLMALREAVEGLAEPADYLLSDGYAVLDAPCPTLAVPKGDAISVSVAAASVLAKVARDRIMCELDACHPGYVFSGHKGYATPQHLAALRHLGPSPAHRRSFGPVGEMERR